MIDISALEAKAREKGLVLTTTTGVEPVRYHLCEPGSWFPILGGSFTLDEVERYLRGEEMI